MSKGRFNNNNAFGVELELTTPTQIDGSSVSYTTSRHQLVAKLREAGIDARVEGYGHDTQTYWKLTTDGTVSSRRGQHGGSELVSPKLYGQDGKEQLKTVLKVCNDFGCQVNVSCGTHVHHDVTNEMIRDENSVELFLKSLIRTVVKYENIIYRLISPSRLKMVNGSYWTRPARSYYLAEAFTLRHDMPSNFLDKLKETSKRLEKKIKRDVSRKVRRHGNRVSTSNYSTPSRTQRDRYCGLNLMNIWKRGSVEFRYHQGTLNFDKLWAWVVFTQALVNSSIDKKTVSFTKVQTNVHGLFHLRKAVGFIGHTNQCDDVKFANKVISKRFKELTTPEMNRKRSNSGIYKYIKESLI